MDFKPKISQIHPIAKQCPFIIQPLSNCLPIGTFIRTTKRKGSKTTYWTIIEMTSIMSTWNVSTDWNMTTPIKDVDSKSIKSIFSLNYNSSHKLSLNPSTQIKHVTNKDFKNTLNVSRKNFFLKTIKENHWKTPSSDFPIHYVLSMKTMPQWL